MPDKDMTFIQIYRRIMQGHMWKDKPFAMGQAWIDLLLEAAWKDHDLMHGYKTIRLKRGDVPHSIRTLAERWGWSRSKVERFVKFLCRKTETDNEPALERISRQGVSLLRVVKYDTYQGVNEKPRQPRDSKRDKRQDGRETDAGQTEKGKQGKEETTTDSESLGNREREVLEVIERITGGMVPVAVFDFIQTFGAEEVREAYETAQSSKQGEKIHPNYVKSILQRWQREGKPSGNAVGSGSFGTNGSQEERSLPRASELKVY